MPPAARIHDRHTCAQSDGAIVPAGCRSVLIGGRPAARRGDAIQCGNKRVEIQAGEPSVLIGDEDAARMGDPVMDGGMIVQGDVTVCIGSNTPTDCMRKRGQARTAFVRSLSLGWVARQFNEAAKPPAPMRIAAGLGLPGAAGGINLAAALTHLRKIALPRSHGLSVQHVWSALLRAGVRSVGNDVAGEMRLALLRAGFRAVATRQTMERYEVRAGDVMLAEGVDQRVVEAAMFDVDGWVGDSINECMSRMSSQQLVWSFRLRTKI